MPRPSVSRNGYTLLRDGVSRRFIVGTTAAVDELRHDVWLYPGSRLYRRDGHAVWAFKTSKAARRRFDALAGPATKFLLRLTS